MTDRRGELESFTRAVEALDPYLRDLVFIDGWAHFLYCPSARGPPTFVRASAHGGRGRRGSTPSLKG